MSRLFYHVMQDNLGNLLFDVSGTMRLAGTGTIATIYGDEALTVVLPNPMTNHPSFGSFKCYLGAGSYDFYMAKAGYTFETLTGVQGQGTMAQQNADAVSITGGAATFTNGATSSLGFSVLQNPANDVSAFYTTMAAGGTNRWAFFGQDTAPSSFGGTVQTGNLGVRTPPRGDSALALTYLKGSVQGLLISPADSDTGGAAAINFTNLALAQVGSITTTASATAFNTSSDARLKERMTALVGALDVLRAVRPIAFHWKRDQSPGVGFAADELQRVLPHVVTGEPDARNADGSIRPQGVDYSKLVPYLVSAVQLLLARVEALEARA